MVFICVLLTQYIVFRFFEYVWGSRGRKFDSCHSDQKSLILSAIFLMLKIRVPQSVRLSCLFDEKLKIADKIFGFMCFEFCNSDILRCQNVISGVKCARYLRCKSVNVVHLSVRIDVLSHIQVGMP